MRKLNINGRLVNFYEVKNYPTLRHMIKSRNKDICYTKGANTREFLNIPCAFDIETTTCNIGSRAEPDWIAFMYHWQFSFDGYCIFGRYWDEFMELLDNLRRDLRLNSDRRLVIYAHFMAYEFQFLRNFINVEKTFCRKKRVPIRVDFDNAFELRCSWALSNMSLAKAIENTPNAFFIKQSGDDFDYMKLRTPSTPLSDKEAIYCYCDVAGLIEYLRYQLKEDTIATIPLTSTGYVRRDFRHAVLKNEANRREINALKLSPLLYVMCKTGRRGGNCHGNAMFTNLILDNVGSYDRKSSYPAEMMVDLFPVSRFEPVRPSNENLSYAMGEKACLMELTFWNVRVKEVSSLPYIALAKCTRVSPRPVVDNGRIIEADYLSMIITDIDYRIIITHYSYTEVEISSIYVADYGHLNDEFRLTLREMFVEKCKLETGDQFLYNKFKNKINASFGMMLTDICSPEIIYDACPPFVNGKQSYWKTGDIDIESMLNRYYQSRNTFLSYQHGIWVTANARYRHQQGIDAVGEDVVYGDTDSVKFIEDHDADFKRLNEEWLALCDNNDISPSVHVNGKTTTLGVWEREKTATKFTFLGAKKYAYIDEDGNFKITVAGLNKKKGAKFLQTHGGLEAFTPSTVIPPEFSGRTTSHYIDVGAPFELTINGETFVTGSCIASVPTTYEFSVKPEYFEYYTSLR